MQRAFVVIGIAIAVATIAVPAFSLLERLTSRSDAMRARRTLAVLQLAKWGVVALSFIVVFVEILSTIGVPSATMAVLGTASATGLAFALRDPLADFIAAATMLAERTMVIGDEVVVNEELRGKVLSVGLRSITVSTWDGDTVFVTASGVKTLRNVSSSASRAIVDIDIPASVRVGRARAVIEAACKTAVDDSFESEPEVIGVVNQFLTHYVLRVTCFVSPARHRRAEYRLNAAAVDAVVELLADPTAAGAETQELVDLVAAMKAPAYGSIGPRKIAD